MGKDDKHLSTGELAQVKELLEDAKSGEQVALPVPAPVAAPVAAPAAPPINPGSPFGMAVTAVSGFFGVSPRLAATLVLVVGGVLYGNQYITSLSFPTLNRVDEKSTVTAKAAVKEAVSKGDAATLKTCKAELSKQRKRMWQELKKRDAAIGNVQRQVDFISGSLAVTMPASLTPASITITSTTPPW
jgi:hypothetical protein